MVIGVLLMTIRNHELRQTSRLDPVLSPVCAAAISQQGLLTLSRRTCPRRPHNRTMTNQHQLADGVFVYVLGLVIIAARPDRFWLGIALAALPILTSAGRQAIAAGRQPSR